MAKQGSPESTTVAAASTSASPTLKFPSWKGMNSIMGVVLALTARHLHSRKSHSDNKSEPTAVATTEATDNQQQPSQGIKQSATTTRPDPEPAANQDLVGHCCFTTSASVRQPRESQRYA